MVHVFTHTLVRKHIPYVYHPFEHILTPKVAAMRHSCMSTAHCAIGEKHILLKTVLVYFNQVTDLNVIPNTLSDNVPSAKSIAVKKLQINDQGGLYLGTALLII